MPARIKFLIQHNNGAITFGVGSVVETSDAEAAMMAAQGIAVIVPITTPCKKGQFNAADYLTCTTPMPESMKASALESNKKETPAPNIVQAKENAFKTSKK